MHLARATLVLATTLCAACGQPTECPRGWQYDEDEPSYCSPTSDWLAGLPVRRGIVGFVKEIDGGCGPGDTTCSVDFLPSTMVRIYEGEAFDHECFAAGGEFSQPVSTYDDAVDALVVETQTDAHGRFVAEVAEGSYCVTAKNPDDGFIVAEQIDVRDGLASAPIVFDNGAY